VRLLILAFAALFALSACQKTSPPGEAPTGVTATAGDGLVVVSWDMLPDLTYWIFFQPGSTVDVATPNSFAIRRAFSPRPLGPLANGTQYAFVMNATHNDSAAGPNSLPVVATPRLAGNSWVSGTPLVTTPGTAPGNLRGIAFNGTRFVTVGDATTTAGVTSPTIFAGDFNYPVGQFNFTTGDPQGVTQWMQPSPTTLPLNFTSNLASVIFTSTGAFVALGADGSVILSGDGLTWTSTSIAAVPASGMNSLAFGFVGGTIGTYVAVGNGGVIYVSDQSLTKWTLVPSGTTNDLTSVSLVSLQNGVFIVTGAGGTLLMSQNPNDGNPFTSLNSNTTNTLRGVTGGPSLPSSTGVLYVAVGDAGTIVTSPSVLNPTVDFTPATITPPIAQNLRGVTVGGSAGTRFLAVGDAGAVAYSDDGVQWFSAASGSDNLAKVLYVGGLYMGVGDAGANAVAR